MSAAYRNMRSATSLRARVSTQSRGITSAAEPVERHVAMVAMDKLHARARTPERGYPGLSIPV